MSNRLDYLPRPDHVLSKAGIGGPNMNPVKAAVFQHSFKHQSLPHSHAVLPNTRREEAAGVDEKNTNNSYTPRCLKLLTTSLASARTKRVCCRLHKRVSSVYNYCISMVFHSRLRTPLKLH